MSIRAFWCALYTHRLASLLEGGGFCEAKDGRGQPALKGDSSRARPVGDAARGESGGIGSIASGSAARRPYSNQRCGFRVSESRRGYNEASVVYANPSVKPSVCQLPVRGAFWYCIASNIKHGDGFPSPQLHKLLRSPAVRRISHCASNISLRFSAISPCVSRISPRA